MAMAMGKDTFMTGVSEPDRDRGGREAVIAEGPTSEVYVVGLVCNPEHGVYDPAFHGSNLVSVPDATIERFPDCFTDEAPEDRIVTHEFPTQEELEADGAEPETEDAEEATEETEPEEEPVERTTEEQESTPEKAEAPTAKRGGGKARTAKGDSGQKR